MDGKLTIQIDETQIERLRFLLNMFNPEIQLEEHKKVTTADKFDLHNAVNKIMNEALHDLYKKTRDQINQGNEHDGLPLIKEIHD